MQCVAGASSVLCVASGSTHRRAGRSARTSGQRVLEGAIPYQLSSSPDAKSSQDAFPLSRVAQQFAAAFAAATITLSSAGPGWTLDSAKVGSCLLQNCQLELAKCLADEKCVESLVCLNTCNGRTDEAACQIRCGDLYADPAVKAFNACAVTNKKCVPQRATVGLYPLPDREALVPDFSTVDYMNGRWYITAGQNPLFDTFPCQVHYFTSTEEGKFFVKINWRVPRANGQFYERSDLQRFVQDPENPAALYNHGNEVLHYQDDWYIVAAKPDKYFLVYYRGSNDAWDGYGGSVLYSREPTVDPEDIPELTAAAKRVGLKWSDFIITDNTCEDEPELSVAPPTDLDVLADDVRALGREAQKEVKAIEKSIEDFEDQLISFSRGFTVLPTKNMPMPGPDKMDPEMKKASRTLDTMQDRMEAEEEGGFLGALLRAFGFGR